VTITDVYRNGLGKWHDIEKSYQDRGRIPQNRPDYRDMVDKSIFIESMQAAWKAACTEDCLAEQRSDDQADYCHNVDQNVH